MSDVMIPTWTLGDRLTKAREAAGIKQGEMAAMLRCGRNTVGNWEAGRTVPNLSVLRDWARLTSVPLWWIEGTEPPASSAADRRQRGPRPPVTEREQRAACPTLDFTRMAA